jgi:hypothetical protein
VVPEADVTAIEVMVMDASTIAAALRSREASRSGNTTEHGQRIWQGVLLNLPGK